MTKMSTALRNQTNEAPTNFSNTKDNPIEISSSDDESNSRKTSVVQTLIESSSIPKKQRKLSIENTPVQTTIVISPEDIKDVS